MAAPYLIGNLDHLAAGLFVCGKIVWQFLFTLSIICKRRALLGTIFYKVYLSCMMPRGRPLMTSRSYRGWITYF